MRPKELSIRLSREAKKRMGLSVAEELRAAENFLKKNRPREARDLLIGVLADQPTNGIARRLLRAAKRQAKVPNRMQKIAQSFASTKIGRMLPVAIKQPIKKLLLASQ